MICTILQTTDPSSIHHWLLHSNDREKNMVIEILCSTLDGRKRYFAKPTVDHTTTTYSPNVPTSVGELIPTRNSKVEDKAEPRLRSQKH
ncbi:unnamed protein product [Dicrocoelium dendriticum]|nr:unnamed protein product [Dicrocoelium dendriticum]